MTIKPNKYSDLIENVIPPLECQTFSVLVGSINSVQFYHALKHIYTGAMPRAQITNCMLKATPTIDPHKHIVLITPSSPKLYTTTLSVLCLAHELTRN